MRKFLLIINLLFITNFAIPQVSITLLPPPPNQLKTSDLWRILATNNSAAGFKASEITVELKESSSGLQLESKLRNVIIPGSKSFSFNDFNTAQLKYHNTKLQEAYLKNLNAPDGNYTICVYVKNERGEVLASDCIDQAILTPIPADLTPRLTIKLLPLVPNKMMQSDLFKCIVTNLNPVPYEAHVITVELKEKNTGLQAESKLTSVTIAGTKILSFNDFNTAELKYHNTKLQEAYSRNLNAPNGNYTICVYVKNERGEILASDCIDQTILTPIPADLTPRLTIKLLHLVPNKMMQSDLFKCIVTNLNPLPYEAHVITVELKEKNTGLQAESKLTSVTIAGTKILSFNDFNTAELKFHNKKLHEAYSRNLNAPDGNYSICAYVKNERGEILASDCIDQTIITLKPEKLNLQLMTPQDGSTLIMNQPVLFSWLLLSMKPGTVINYRIKVVEIINNQTSITAMNGNPAWYEKVDIRATTLTYPVAAAKFMDGKKYAWQITAYLKNEEIGKSEIWSFIYGSEDNADKIIEEKQCDVFKVEFKKALLNGAISYKLLITNNYKGKLQSNKPKSFRITVKSDSVLSIKGGVTKDWKRTPSKFPPGSSSVIWTSTLDGIPNDSTNLGSLIFRDIYSKPIKVLYEWLDKDDTIICKDSAAIIESRIYYELSQEIPNSLIELPDNILNIQYTNNYTSIDDVNLSIYDVEKYEFVKPKSKENNKVRSSDKEIKQITTNGLNRISIDIKDYNLELGTTYLLTVSDSKYNYYFKFKVTNDREK